LTVIGGQSSTGGLTGLVTIPSGFTGSVLSSLQSLLISASGAVSANAANFEKLDVAGQSGAQSATVGSFSTGVLVLANSDSTNASTAGSANVSLNVPTGYNTLIVEAPGSETISGNGASNFLGIFGANSTVNFTGGGSGSIFGGGPGDFLEMNGGSWSVFGSSSGDETVNVGANNIFVSVSGAGNATGNEEDTASAHSNVVGLSGANATVSSNGTNDLIASYGGSADIVSVNGSAAVLITGGSDTVYATAASTAAKAFFSSQTAGGTIDFINMSTTAASVLGSSFTNAAAGSATIFGGAGGGYYQGGNGGNNSLVGGTGAVTLIAAGIGNMLSAAGGSNDALFAVAGGSATMIAGAGTSNVNLVGAYGDNDSILSSGSGYQAFFIGADSSETLTGSMAASSNSYLLFQNTGSLSGGLDVITNFRYGTDHLFINPTGYAQSQSGVSIAAFDPISGSQSGTLLQLNNGTLIKLLGVSLTGAEQSSILSGGGITI